MLLNLHWPLLVESSCKITGAAGAAETICWYRAIRLEVFEGLDILCALKSKSMSRCVRNVTKNRERVVICRWFKFLSEFNWHNDVDMLKFALHLDFLLWFRFSTSCLSYIVNILLSIMSCKVPVSTKSSVCP